MGVQMHPRRVVVRQAKSALSSALLDWEESDAVKDLTPLEVLSVLQDVLGGQLSSLLKYEIRHERHGNYDTPGGLASSDED